jgi:hypothetical protein
MSEAGFVGAVTGRQMLRSQTISYPVYLLQGDAVEHNGKVYIVSEPLACCSPKDLEAYVLERKLEPRERVLAVAH